MFYSVSQQVWHGPVDLFQQQNAYETSQLGPVRTELIQENQSHPYVGTHCAGKIELVNAEARPSTLPSHIPSVGPPTLQPPR